MEEPRSPRTPSHEGPTDPAMTPTDASLSVTSTMRAREVFGSVTSFTAGVPKSVERPFSFAFVSTVIEQRSWA